MKYHQLQGDYRNITQSIAEALDAAYVFGKSSPYRVPCQLDGDLFYFKTVKTSVEAINIIREAAAESVSRVIPTESKGKS